MSSEGGGRRKGWEGARAAQRSGPGAAMVRVAHVPGVAGAEISQKPLSLSVPESGLYISAGLYLLGYRQLSTRR